MLGQGISQYPKAIDEHAKCLLSNVEIQSLRLNGQGLDICRSAMFVICFQKRFFCQVRRKEILQILQLHCNTILSTLKQLKIYFQFSC